MDKPDQTDNWLARPATVKLIWRAFALVLVVTVLAQLAVSVKGYFLVDGWFGFGAVFGFLSCLAMVLVAKCLGYLVKRREKYYREGKSE